MEYLCKKRGGFQRGSLSIMGKCFCFGSSVRACSSAVLEDFANSFRVTGPPSGTFEDKRYYDCEKLRESDLYSVQIRSLFVCFFTCFSWWSIDMAVLFIDFE